MLVQGRFSGRLYSGVAEAHQRANVALRTAPIARTEPQAPQFTPPISLTWDPRSTGLCVLWLRGDFGAAKTYWNDASGYNNRAVQTGGATYEPATFGTAINSQPTVTFNGTTHYTLPVITTGTVVATTVVVFKLSSAIGASAFGALCYWLSDDPTNNSNAIVLCGTSTTFDPYSFKFGYSTGASVGYGTATDTSAHALTIAYDGVSSTSASSYAAKDNAVTQTVTTSDVFGAITGHIAADTAGANGITGDIAEVIIFKGTLSGADRTSLDEYLARRYGSFSITGTGTGTLSSLVSSGTGTHTNGATGTGSGTLSPLVSSGSGAETMTGTGSGTLSPLVASSTGTETFTGTGSGVLSPLVASASGSEVFTGTGSGVLSPLVASGSGTLRFTGTGSGTISPLVSAGTGAETFTGTGTGTLSSLVATASGTERFTGTGSGTLSPLVASGTAAESFVGTGSAALSPLVAAASGSLVFAGTGGGVLSSLVASGVGSGGGLLVTGTGSAALSPLAASGTATLVISGTGSASIAPLVALGFFVPRGVSSRLVITRNDARVDLDGSTASVVFTTSTAKATLQ